MVNDIINIKSKILNLRGKQVILDSDLARLYEVDTKRLNEQVKRNLERFPIDFMFQLDESEYKPLENNGTESSIYLRSQIATIKEGRGKHRKYLPYAFTEQGVAMLSGILRSKKAVEVNIQVMRAFVVMRRFVSRNAEIIQRLDKIDQKQVEYDRNFRELFEAIDNKEFARKQGIFFDGQIFDAYLFVSDLIKSAKRSIKLIDSYVDESVLILFSKTNADVVIYTKPSRQLALDLEKYNSQYKPIIVKEFTKSHDRFLIIDEKEAYHIGASLKDLGKKWFAFSKMDMETIMILEKLE